MDSFMSFDSRHHVPLSACGIWIQPEGIQVASHLAGNIARGYRAQIWSILPSKDSEKDIVGHISFYQSGFPLITRLIVCGTKTDVKRVGWSCQAIIASR